MSRLYITLLAIAAFLISGIGAVFSIAGLTSLFAGATLTVGGMAAALEFAKLVTAGFLYRYWGHINTILRAYLSITVIILSGITSMGIFGYLSNAYQRSSVSLRGLQLEMSALKSEEARISEEMKKIEKFIDEIPRNRISKKFAFYDQSRGQMNRFRKQSTEANKKIQEMELKILNKQTEIGPLIYVAETFHANVDSVARLLILIFVSVFDPLAICLVFALNMAIRLKEKYRGDEQRIAKLSISQPVDHRFKKTSHKKSA